MIIVSPLARRDLIQIGVYTEKQWGKRQRKKYLGELKSRIEKLAQTPALGRRREELPGNPYMYHESRHVIFYRVIDQGIEIIRVLHDSRDFQRHL
jgi:toxin ParE1/3/4